MFTPYQPRPLSFLGPKSIQGYQLKTYAIRYGDELFNPDRFAGAWALAADILPQPAMAPERPGVGFAILHQGKTADYFILCWWDHQNELPTKVFLSGPEGWRPAAVGESFCVWDLRVMWWEREAYVATVLAGRSDGLDDYLAATVEGHA